VIADVASDLDARSQRVVQHVDADATVVTGDPAKLHDALRNLLHNATNYAPEGTEIVLASARRDHRIVLSVADSGPGIPETDLPRIFERFYRVDKARSRNTRDPGGTGLGLAIVKHIIERHRGSLDIRSTVGVGTSVTVRLPIAV
jgi:two-component system phosphate regulon sensor histidine kinase PhoR